ncbi:hypothetical protein J1614_009164 [Plenodomus biglobosus]|nr:hypothetical protein J1614_009164 [Plenodomus biglobosus]
METLSITKKLIAFGSKKIYLPKFTIAFIRTPRLSPYHARFLVPLDFSKYDLRDYLYHAYNVRCFNIRSYVKQMPVRDTTDQQRHWFRPDSKKYMTVEMEQPFVWPERPDLTPWSQKEFNNEIEKVMDTDGSGSATEQRNNARKLRDQVKKLLSKDMKDKDQGVSQRTWRQKKREFREQSVLEFWEKTRQDKVTTSDEAERFTVRV